MVLSRACVTILLGSLLTLASCGGQSTNPKASGAGSAGDASAASAGSGMEGGAPNATGGTAGVGGAGTQSIGGGAGAESGGMSGLGGGAGHGNTAGLGGRAGGTIPELPGASDREREILAPLSTDDATIDATSGGDLTALARAVGAARGYTMCRCLQSPNMAPADVEQTLSNCGVEESGFQLAEPDESRCVEEGMAVLPAAEDYLRCRIKWIRDDSSKWASRCSNPGVPYAPEEYYCMASPETELLLQQCRVVVYCGDDTRVLGTRCDGGFACTDQSDERGCFELRGQDMFWCGPEIVRPWDLCRYRPCELENTPPVCDPDRPDVYLCNDGGEVSMGSVCNRASDCRDGSDERYCFR